MKHWSNSAPHLSKSLRWLVEHLDCLSHSLAFNPDDIQFQKIALEECAVLCEIGNARGRKFPSADIGELLAQMTAGVGVSKVISEADDASMALLDEVLSKPLTDQKGERLIDWLLAATERGSMTLKIGKKMQTAIQEVLMHLIDRYLELEDWRLLSKVLMGCRCLRIEQDSSIRAWQSIFGAQLGEGDLPSKQFSFDRLAVLEMDERRRHRFQQNFHPTIGFAKAALLQLS